MEITEVRVKLMDEPGERLQAFCSITFDDAFVVRDLKIIEGASGPFVAMPSRKLTARCPQCGYKNHLRACYCNQCGIRLQEQSAGVDDEGRAKLYADIAHPINSACREMIQQRVIAAYEEERRRSKLPGYVPSYDDEFDAGPVDLPPARDSYRSSTSATSSSDQSQKAIQPTVIEGAERPRGPHTGGPTKSQPGGARTPHSHLARGPAGPSSTVSPSSASSSSPGPQPVPPKTTEPPQDNSDHFGAGIFE